MSADYATMKYAKGAPYGAATYGSVAYDLGRVQTEYEIPAQPIPREKERTETKAKPRQRAEQRTQGKTGLSVFSIVGFALIAVMMVFVVLANVRLTEISYSVSETRSRIAELENEREQLEAQYETAFNLTELKSYAMDNLNMVEASTSEAIILGGVRKDKAEIIDSSLVEEKGIVETASNFLTSLLEYFK